MRCVLLPGLGADERLFVPQKIAFPRIETPRWIPPRPRESLREYSLRWAESFNKGDRVVLGGASLGGIVALEMVHALNPECVVLLGSARDRQALSSLAWGLLRVTRLQPGGLTRWLAGREPLVSLFGPMDRRVKSIYREMVEDADPWFVKWALDALSRWPGAPQVDCPVLAIHGQLDRVFPARRARADHLIDGAGHLLTLTHGEEVNAILRSLLSPSCP